MAFQKQFDRALSLGWRPHFQEAARTFTLPEARLWAIASRETNLDPLYLEKKGDNGHGPGLMQIDDRSFKTWCGARDPENPKRFMWQNPKECILMGAQVLAAKRTVTAVLIKRGYFSMDNRRRAIPAELQGLEVEDHLRVQIYVAAYNCGEGGALKGYVLKQDPDTFTAHGNYGTDVLEREKIFEQMLAEIRP